MLAWLAAYDGPLFDSCVTDPPYHLTGIGRTLQLKHNAMAKDGVARRKNVGFMGKAWDGGDIAFRPETWAAVLGKMKPGAHLIAFSGTRTYHRMACAIEDAGFEIRDQLAWCYGSGFPKSHNAGDGWGTALKPAWEPICLARKPLEGTVAANVAKHGTGAINIDGCRIDGIKGVPASPRKNANGGDAGGIYGRFEPPPTDTAGWDANAGRWPANILHDGSDEVLAGFPETTSGAIREGSPYNHSGCVTMGAASGTKAGFDSNAGSAARFFYSAKAGPLDRLGSAHATVKPVDVMRWLCRLVTPKGGLILEPFAGSGTTGIAAMAEGFDCQMVELEADHFADIERKLAFLRGEGRMSFVEHDRKRDDAPAHAGPLFGAAA